MGEPDAEWHILDMDRIKMARIMFDNTIVMVDCKQEEDEEEDNKPDLLTI